MINISTFYNKMVKETTYHFGLFLLDWRKLMKMRAFLLSTSWLSSWNLGWKSNINTHSHVM